MTDPTPNTDQPADEEQMANFSWWVCMLPFVIGAGVFCYLWWQHRADPGGVNNLMYALGTLIIGMVISGLINGASGEGDSATASTTGGTASADAKTNDKV